jgi:hypothetical protein
MNVDTAVTVPVNLLPLISDSDFKTRMTSIAYNEAGMDLQWNFVTTAGVLTYTSITPTSSGVYDWFATADGIYVVEIPASGGGTANNDSEGFGWITGVCTGVLPFRGPVVGFRAAVLNNALINYTEFQPVDAHMQEFTITGATLQPKKVDGSTNTSYSRTLATDAGALPIVSST